MIYNKETNKFEDTDAISAKGMYKVRKLLYTTARIKRYHINQKIHWNSPYLTWSFFSNLLPANLTRNQVVLELSDAFALWERTTSWKTNRTILRFTQIEDNDESANIKIRFQRNNHNDSYPFDGPGGILAHAFFPTKGELHLDVDEPWMVNETQPDGVYLFSVVAHEIGHVLGLQHSSVKEALMYPWYQSVDVLAADDVNGLEQLYVSNPRRRLAPMPTNNLFSPLPAPKTCLSPRSIVKLQERLVLFWPNGLKVPRLWREMCDVSAVAQINQSVFFVHKKIWYEYKQGRLVNVGLVKGGVSDIDLLFQEKNGQVFATKANYVYKVRLTRTTFTIDKRSAQKLKFKFRGVGTKLSYFTPTFQDDVFWAGHNNFIWEMTVVHEGDDMGLVYETVNAARYYNSKC
ncbi:mp-nase [Hyphantria cunea granulovirus]|uniref:Mp-nase n=1 Tax=Hyphantria cunea granulovirus TaxID=307448 RepID=A0AAE6D0K9_9BBAC|nr:mp-nase [Hyphantria cunea granulovirus]QBQ01590.1 mp-nase [Hyphantria cunea granulovirus]